MARIDEVRATIGIMAVIAAMFASSMVAMSQNEGSISCAKVIEEMGPCLSFIKGTVDKPSEACCDGARTMVGNTKNKGDKIATCNCIKESLGHLKYDPDRIPLIPKNCALNVTFPPITNSTDCSKVGFGIAMYGEIN